MAPAPGPAPQGASQGPPGAGPAPQGPGPGQGPTPPGGASPAAQIVAQIHDGFMKLSQMFDQAKGAVSPQDKQQLAALIAGFQALIADMTKGPGQAAPAPKAPGGPMAQNAGKKSVPAQF